MYFWSFCPGKEYRGTPPKSSELAGSSVPHSETYYTIWRGEDIIKKMATPSLASLVYATTLWFLSLSSPHQGTVGAHLKGDCVIKYLSLNTQCHPLTLLNVPHAPYSYSHFTSQPPVLLQQLSLSGTTTWDYIEGDTCCRKTVLACEITCPLALPYLGHC